MEASGSEGKGNSLVPPPRPAHDGRMSPPGPRPQLHVIVDPAFTRGRSLAGIASAVVAAGADVVQLRDKTATPAQTAAVVRRLLPLVRDGGARLLVNDHWDVARDEGADGVHVGPGDTPVDEIRRRCPRPFLIGASARTAEVAARAERRGADYLGVGPVYGTSSKADAPAAVGLERITGLARATRLPVIGIGGVAPGNAAAVVLAGGRGVAVISSVVAADDPAEATRRLRRELDAAAAPLAG